VVWEKKIGRTDHRPIGSFLESISGVRGQGEVGSQSKKNADAGDEQGLAQRLKSTKRETTWFLTASFWKLLVSNRQPPSEVGGAKGEEHNCEHQPPNNEARDWGGEVSRCVSSAWGGSKAGSSETK